MYEDAADDFETYELNELARDNEGSECPACETDDCSCRECGAPCTVACECEVAS
jgi:hypothetical protein